VTSHIRAANSLRQGHIPNMSSLASSSPSAAQVIRRNALKASTDAANAHFKRPRSSESGTLEPSRPSTRAETIRMATGVARTVGEIEHAEGRETKGEGSKSSTVADGHSGVLLHGGSSVATVLAPNSGATVYDCHGGKIVDKLIFRTGYPLASGEVSGGVPVNRNIDLTSSLVYVPIPLVGTSSYNRIGRRIEAKFVRVKAHVYFAPLVFWVPHDNNRVQTSMTPDMGSIGYYARVLFIYDKFGYKAPIYHSDILQDIDNVGNGCVFNSNSTVISSLANRNPVNTHRFEILYDKTSYVEEKSVAGQTFLNGAINTIAQRHNFGVLPIDFLVDCNKKEMLFAASTGNESDLIAGSMFMHVAVNVSGAQTAIEGAVQPLTFGMVGMMRLEYTD